MYMQPQYFLPLFAALWFGMSALLAHWGGWAHLARKYRTRDAAEGECFRFVSGSMGNRFMPVNYGNCLFIAVNASGIRLSILFPFRFQSPPLYVPWLDVESVSEKRFLFLFRYVVITVKEHWPRISLWGRAGQAVLKFYGAGSNRAPTSRSTRSRAKTRAPG
jgi:hypothetical protein